MLEVSVPIAHELLAQCVKQGQALVQRASLVGDFSDYEAWKSARKQWIDPTVHALEHMYGGPREAREFADAATCAEGGRRWQQQYAADLECVNGAIELLTVLQGELAFDAPPTAALATEADAPREPAPAPAIVQEPAAIVEERPAIVEEEQAPAIVQQPDPPARAELTRAPLVGAELTQQDSSAPAERISMPPEAAPTRTRRVFVAHGRDERWKDAVAHVLERAGSEEVVILDGHAEERAKLLEQIADQAQGARYAIVLLTADDIGAARLESAEEPYFTTRARQGVVFELGFLVAALTPGRVCVLYEDGVELPCELEGISHVRLDLAGTWQPKLLLALRRAGFEYDLNRLAAA
ncbi:MAG TPA: nucleotide-binding protein [Solirubrobacteraceae bacterium]|jgi:predicted nucleotide-binding protein|nr:nucleotide-binding protein [Solirubrobacteraceae bacterium]